MHADPALALYDVHDIVQDIDNLHFVLNASHPAAGDIPPLHAGPHTDEITFQITNIAAHPVLTDDALPDERPNHELRPGVFPNLHHRKLSTCKVWQPNVPPAETNRQSDSHRTKVQSSTLHPPGKSLRLLYHHQTMLHQVLHRHKTITSALQLASQKATLPLPVTIPMTTNRNRSRTLRNPTAGSKNPNGLPKTLPEFSPPRNSLHHSNGTSWTP